jgi:uncharacterized cofD-like protein
MGPGSLYTSVLPNLLIKEIAQKVAEADAYKVYVSNIMTQPGETDNLTSEGHLHVLIDHIDEKIVDVCIVNNGEIPQEMIDKYNSQNSGVVPLDVDKIRALGCEVVAGDVVRIDETVRHDPEKLAKVIFDTFLEHGIKEDN